MTPFRTENGFHQFTGTICHSRLSGELGVTLNEHPQPDDLSDAIQTLRRLCREDGKGIESTLASGLESTPLTHLVWNTSTRQQDTIREWNLTTDVHQVPHSFGRDVRGNRAWGLRQDVSEVKKRLFGTWALRGHDQRIPLRGMGRLETVSDNSQRKS
tara:strand:- start:95 stop:565 length:471 start_codon:yes stop_codon:yes gene_type:complete